MTRRKAGDRAALRFLEFFTVNIRNRNTRAAYARAAGDFPRWCEGQGIGELERVHPVHVAAYIELLAGSASGSHGQTTSGLYRMLFDWLVAMPNRVPLPATPAVPQIDAIFIRHYRQAGQ
jgi:site-specific recombinase XerD